MFALPVGSKGSRYGLLKYGVGKSRIELPIGTAEAHWDMQLVVIVVVCHVIGEDVECGYDLGSRIQSTDILETMAGGQYARGAIVGAIAGTRSKTWVSGARLEIASRRAA